MFIAAVVASLLSRPTAVYMFPAYLVLVLRQGGVRRLAERRVAAVTLAALVLGGIMAIGYLALSPFNSGVVLDRLRDGVDANVLPAMGAVMMRERPGFVVLAAGLVAAVLTRDRRVLAPLTLALSVVVCAVVLTGSIELDRYSILSVPALCLIGASVVAATRTSARRSLCGRALIVVGLQLAKTAGGSTQDAPGYGAAARYVVEAASATGPKTVLYRASIDTGYFVFFVRKHDPARRLVVLRSDKLLTTSRMATLSVEDLIHQPDEIYGVLKRYGTRFVLIEDRPSGATVLDSLESSCGRVASSNDGVSIGDAAPGLQGVSLAMYEYSTPRRRRQTPSST